MTRFYAHLALGAIICSAASVRAQSYSRAELVEVAQTFPAQPRESVDLLQAGYTPPASFTFGSGTPFNDLAYTLYDVDYIDGETNGFDTFEPADAADAFPGDGTVKLVRGTSNVDLDVAYSGPAGDRIILGRPEVPRPYFYRGADGVDDEWAVIQNYDYNHGYIQLLGTAADYRLVYATAADSVATEGHYLFYVGDEAAGLDLIAFIWPCDEFGLPVSGNPFRDSTSFCNAAREIALDDGVNFRFVDPAAERPGDVLPGALTQFGTPGKEIVHGIAVDSARNLYLYGASDGTVGGTLPEAGNTVWARRINADGSTGWAYELEVTNGTLLFDGATDASFLYLGGRTLGAIPGFTNAGRWDGILLKLDLATGELVASDQFGTASLDGYGNLVLDGHGGLYVSGAGGKVEQEGTDPDHLIAKHDAATLANVWRVVEAPQTSEPRVFVSEAWGGLSYAPATATEPSRLLAGGWYMGPGGSAGFLSLYEDVDGDQPVRAAAAVLNSPGTEADWVLDNAIGPDGSLYAAGYTTGQLGDRVGGEGDAYIVKYAADLTNPRVVQVGGPAADMFRKLELSPGGDRLYAIGYSYGDLAGANSDEVLGTGDVYAAAFDTDLELVAETQFGSAFEDRGFAAVFDDIVFVGGYTEGVVAGPNAGAFDAFALALDGATLEVVPQADLPEPDTSTSALTTLSAETLSVYPNPTADVLHVRMPEAPLALGEADITFRDASGRLVGRAPSRGDGEAIDVAALRPGWYVLTVRTDTHVAHARFYRQ